MPCSDWLRKGPICLLCLLALLCSDLESRNFDKCTAEDGRPGYCAPGIYCREGHPQELQKCEGKGNYCCPFPATSATEKPKRHIVERPRRPSNDGTLFGDEGRLRPSDQDDKPTYEQPRRPTNDGTLYDDEDRRRPSEPRYGSELDDKPVYERPRRPTSGGTRYDDRLRPSGYAPEVEVKPIYERPRRPTSDGGFTDEDDRRPSGPRSNPELDDKPIYERPRRPTNDGAFTDEDSRRSSGPRSNPELDDKPVYERPRRPTNDGTRYEDRLRPSESGYDPESDDRPIYGRPKRPTNDETRDEDRHRPSGPRYGPGLDENDSPYFTKPRDVDKSRETYGSNNGKPRDSSGYLPDSAGSRRPEMPNRPGETYDYNLKPSEASRPVSFGPVRPDGTRGDDWRPDDRTDQEGHRSQPRTDRTNVQSGPSRSQGTDRSRRPVPGDRTRTLTDEDIPLRRETPGSRLQGDPKVSNGRRVDKDRPRHRPENSDRREYRPKEEESPSNSRTRGRQPSRADEEVPRAPSKNATLSRTPDGRGPQMPKIPGCGVRPYKLFIAGGEVSDDHEWPWMAAIFRRFQDSRPKAFLCGGSLINNRFVLTAAHCFVNNYVILPASSFIVRLGSNYLDSGEEYTVANLILHHNHSGSDYFNDIALIRLAGEVAVTDKIAPICLPTQHMARMDLVGLTATVAGWGDVEYRTSGTRVLQHVTIPIVSNQECSSAYSRVRGAAFLARGTDHVICAGLKEGGKDACLGDSGGPLMLLINEDQWVVVGVVSLGYKCAEPGYYGVYTRVTHYTSWIEGHVRQRH